MTIGLSHLLLLFAALWSAAVVVKAIGVMRSKQPYTFGMWDGGALRAGKSLSRNGTLAKVVIATSLSISSAAVALGALSARLGSRVVISLAIVSVVADLAFTVRE